MNKTRLLVVLGLIVLGVAAYWFDLGQYLSLDFFHSQQDRVQGFVADQPTTAAAIFFTVYVTVAALNIPGATIMTLIAGALFGLTRGTVIVSFASTIGATLAFLLSRFLLRDYVDRRFGAVVGRVNQGIAKDGAYYLFGLRLVPGFPFVVINLVMGLTRLHAWTFYWVSQLGMLAGTVVYVNAGTQLGKIESVSEILSPQVIGSFVLLGLFPLVAKKIMDAIAAKRTRKHFDRPDDYDANLVVIGAGSAGLVTAYIGAAAKAKVVLVEKDKMGGDCLNTGCVPSKALIRSSRIMSDYARRREFGLFGEPATADLARVMQRVHKVIERIEPHDSAERYKELGVDVRSGTAVIKTPWCVEVDGRPITTRNIVIATGSVPAVPPIPGVQTVDYLTSDNLWELDQLPQKLLVLGGGVIGCEMAQAFRRLGSEVTVVEMLPQLLGREDRDVAAAVEQQFAEEGISLLLGYRGVAFETVDDQQVLRCESEDDVQEVRFDKVLIVLGRRANTQGLGLEDLGIPLNQNGTVEVNKYLQCIYPNIFACGDVAGPFQLTHAGAHQAWYCAMNALFRKLKKFRVDYSVIPYAVFTDPEVARVGISERDASEQGIEYEVTRYGIDDLDRAIADGEARGFVKVLTPPGRDKILGVAIVGSHSAEIISEFVLAMRHGLGLGKILGTVHSYPTWAEANKYAAGQWRKARLSPRLLDISERFHRWQR
jgi:pyruvate/2-oxoglutarate dehydrogenase complex dihydrolipoamide dehydrogenase (E3) component/uncharacterized membrane protein YdjX (TVP38/TMEM64 family)